MLDTKRFLHRLFSVCVTLQFSAAPVLGDAYAVRADSIPARRDSGRIQAGTQTRFVLDRPGQAATFEGLTVSLPEDYRQGLPVLVETRCVARAETPPLAIDETSYRAGAKLVNLTASTSRGCQSYQVAAHEVLQPHAERPPSIAIDVSDVSPPPKPSLISRPAIFVFNPVHGNWTEAKPYTPAQSQQNHTYATLSEQNAQIIGGVITVPQTASAEPSHASPSSLAKPLEGVSPVEGYLSIDKIEPDNKGAYGISLPLLLRPSRGPGPSFSVRYSSAGQPGVLGRGWDLSISMIEVRGTAPLYDLNYETEDYVLDGMDLIPLDGDGKDLPQLHKGGPIIPRVSPRAFRLRNNTSGLLVRRFGDRPSEYSWEVWDPHSHTTRLYGSTPDGDLAPALASENGRLHAPEVRDAIGQWALTEEYDNQPGKNGAIYKYVQGNCPAPWTAQICSLALRLAEVDYNLALNKAVKTPVSGQTRVTFDWTPREPERIISDARLGFLRVSPAWLAGITVDYIPEAHNIWLADAGGGLAAPTRAIFSKHRFDLTDENPCMNYERALTRYTVSANPAYDVNDAVGVKTPIEQTFTFHYQGEKSKATGPSECSRSWIGKSQSNPIGKLPASAPAGDIGFPSDFIGELGYGLETQASLLGTGRTQDVGASIYMGLGLAGNPNVKDLTVGLKAGMNFSKSMGTSTLVDINGDGIDDIVYRDGDSLRYCAGERGEKDTNGVYRIVFPPEHCGTIEGVTDFSVSVGSMFNVGVEFYPGFTTFAGVGYSASINDSYAYFVDRDGDGLVDIVYYGQIFYNLGEDRNSHTIRFSRKRSLTPPVPGSIRPEQLSNHADPEVRKTIRDIEQKLAAISSSLKQLNFSQTTLSWVAPFDGAVRLDGNIGFGSSAIEKDSALGPYFDAAHFQDLHDQTTELEENYIKARTRCEIWSDEPRCASAPSSEAYIDFPKPPTPQFQIAVSRSNKVTACTAPLSVKQQLDISSVTLLPVCRDDRNSLNVKAGDVVYFTYSVHPLYQNWAKPVIKVTYTSVPGDAAFLLSSQGDPQRRLKSLPCLWKDQARDKSDGDCLLSRQSRYAFGSETALLPTTPGAFVEIPSGSEREFGGRFEIPRDVIEDYRVYFDVIATRRPLPPSGVVPNPRPAHVQLNAQNADTLDPQRLFRQPITGSCPTGSDICTVDIEPKPPCARAIASECDDFWTGNSGSYALATRLSLEYRNTGADIVEAQNVGARLSAVKWRIPPHLASFPTAAELAAPADNKRSIFYLPFSVPDEDIEYRRVEEGNFASPDTDLRDSGQPDPANINFRSIVSDEQANADLARTRQVIGLCGFAEEIFYFLKTHNTSAGAPFASDFLGYWRRKIDSFSGDCKQAKAALAAVNFTEGDRPESSAGDRNGLRLPELLRALPYAEQMTSAETLLERVLTNFALGRSLMTDDPRLTRRGYRLPIKVNPLDCDQISSLAQANIKPLSEPIVGPDKGVCKYRFSTNFAMQELEDLTDPNTGKPLLNAEKIRDIRRVLARYATSPLAAFDIELTATVNGLPITFRELTGEKAGNEHCKPAINQTCMGNYGTIDPIETYFYPRAPRHGDANNHGDAFPRITTNKRTGRAVAFANTIMNIIGENNGHDETKCKRNYRPFKHLAEVEAKQDCVFAYSDIGPEQKYVGSPVYRIAYSIGENNQFLGRNRVFEFAARPLDVLEFHFRISGAKQTIMRGAAPLTGRFSVLESKQAENESDPLPMGLSPGRHFIPRSPSQILPGGDTDLFCRRPPFVSNGDLEEDPRPAVWRKPGSDRLRWTCRPWTRLGWTEVLLGAEYRTYSDAQKILPGKASNTFSLKRRREILRLQPEVEVQASGYVLEYPKEDLPFEGPDYTDLPDTQRELFLRHDPTVAKVGGDWALFAMRAATDGQVLPPWPFIVTPFWRLRPNGPEYARSVRFDTPGTIVGTLKGAQERYEGVAAEPGGSCDKPGQDARPDYAKCGDALRPLGSEALTLATINIFPLTHRFVGPVYYDTAKKAWEDTHTNRPQTSVCASELPHNIANCWKGPDDTIFFESAVRDVTAPPDVYSVSALIGFEKPPLAEFDFQFGAYGKIICMDREYRGDPCLAPIPADATNKTPFPNRPNPPDDRRVVEVFAPIQGTSSSSISQNAGAALLNEDSSETFRKTRRRYLDVNGDGFPDVIDDGVVELSSPVGLSRRDWWTYFRAAPSGAPVDLQATTAGFQEDGTSYSGGRGIGLSASTFAQLAKTKTTGSPDPNVDPSFNFSLDRGFDTSSHELLDLNGDGLPDFVTVGKQASSGLGFRFNAGNRLLTGADNNFNINARCDLSVTQVYYNTTHSSGFDVRLGFSFGAGSFAAGAGLDHRDGGSQAAFIDITGSGRPDLVVPAEENGDFWVLPNLGNGFGCPRKHHLKDWFAQVVPDLGTDAATSLSETTLVDAGALVTYGTNIWFLKVVVTPGMKLARGQTRELIGFRDINGDGAPDIVAVSGKFLPGGTANELVTQVYYNPEANAHLLTDITNPSGSQWSLSHDLIGGYGSENGRAVWALTGVAQSDGFDPRKYKAKGELPSHGQDVRLTTYEYRNGYFNRAERQFYGFGERTTSVWGCDLAAEKAGDDCLEAVRDGGLAADKLTRPDSGYRKLQVVEERFSNADFLSQGQLLSQEVSGVQSAPDALASPPQTPVSRTVFGYSIEGLSSFTSAGHGACLGGAINFPSTDDSWTTDKVSTATSEFPKAWRQRGDVKPTFAKTTPLLGSGGICASGVSGCTQQLGEDMCNAGFFREQTAFWAQQSGSLRQRMTSLETFADELTAFPPADDGGSNRLRSAVAFDPDEWGQTLRFYEIGEANRNWEPVNTSSTHTEISYSAVDALPHEKPGPYPLMGLAQDIQVFPDAWGDARPRGPPIRVREALYEGSKTGQGTGNVTDVCLYPGGPGFAFRPGICDSYKASFDVAFADGYSTVESALRKAYQATDGLPKGDSAFSAIIHHRFPKYDDFGNLLLAVSPLSHDREWIERRYNYDEDPFRRTASATVLTRCVNDIAGAGTDTERVAPQLKAGCTFGLGSLPATVARKPITHVSRNRIDTHFGLVAETKDINNNSLLFDFDRWGRLSLIARSWGNAPHENKTKEIAARLDLAIKKNDRRLPDSSDDWRILAAADYARSGDGMLRANLRRFESSGSYSGLLGMDHTTRETATFSDGLGRPIQTLKEADVCLGAKQDVIEGTGRYLPTDTLSARCKATATAIAVPAPRKDALERDLETYEPYVADSNKPRAGSEIRFEDLAFAPADLPAAHAPGDLTPAKLRPVTRTTFDGAGRPTLIESPRLNPAPAPGAVLGASQLRYRIVPETDHRAARFEALSLSPRCSLTATWSDGRGLKRTIFEDQTQFYEGDGKPLPGAINVSPYVRNLSLTEGYCAPMTEIDKNPDKLWTERAKASEEAVGLQPSRVSYSYDPLQQLTGVESPLSGTNRAATMVRFDLMGRTAEIDEPNAGCTGYSYDGLNSLISEKGFAFEQGATMPCGTTSKVHNEKAYTYSGGRLVEMAYRSLDEQGGPVDKLDTVHLYYDRSPYAINFGETLEASRFVPNDQANQRFIDVAGRKCDNCIGQVTVVTDHTGARAFSFNELGLARREVRSIVGPLHDVKPSGGESEMFLPEIAFYEQQNSYSAFGDPVQEQLAESAPMNPANKCIESGVNTCLGRFSIGRKYAADGAVAQLFFNGRPIINAAQDDLGRSAIRWTSDGITTGYRYDTEDLRLDQMTTTTAAASAEPLLIQRNGYQYDGGGNILGYANGKVPDQNYASHFEFQYDPASRLIGFTGAAAKQDAGKPPPQTMTSAGTYAYDQGYRFASRCLIISGDPDAKIELARKDEGDADPCKAIHGRSRTAFSRSWAYTYGAKPAHAPRQIDFAIKTDAGDAAARSTLFSYDDLGRMSGIGSGTANKETGVTWSSGAEKQTGLLTNRTMTWDAEGRLIGARGVSDGAATDNDKLLRDSYAYDSGGNRTLKILRPFGRAEGEKVEKEYEAATIYMTPFYARPYDARGTVELSQGSFPAVSLSAPTEPSEDAQATHLYADLPVGSVNVAATVLGEATDPNATKLARREYEPFGLELTTDAIADTVRYSAPMSAFQGKEVDRGSSFISFGSRYFSRDVGVWVSPDRAMLPTATKENWGVKRANIVAFNYQNPVTFSDKDGNNPGLCYAGYFACSDVRAPSNPIVDVGILPTINQIQNVPISLANASVDLLGGVGRALEPYTQDIDAFAYSLQAAGPLGTAGEASALATSRTINFMSTLGRFGRFAEEAEVASKGISSELVLGKTVAGHLGDVVKRGPYAGELARPYLNSRLLMEEIMSAGKSVPDPQGVPGALRWDVPGSFRGTNGTWQLLIKDNEVWHFNFTRD